MRADRLVSILLLLQSYGRLTSRSLAERLEVSPRTIHRDIEALCAAGVPVIATRGAGGGWQLPDDYRTNITGLTTAEIQALFLGPPERVLADLGLQQAAEAALIKLLAALPAIFRHDAEQARRRVYVDATGWHALNEPVPYLSILQAAVWREQRVRLVYQRGDAAVVERVVDPLGLVSKGRAWYLVAAVDGEPRTYRVSRVQAAWIIDEPCRVPPDFDLAAYWERSVADLKAGVPRFASTVRADRRLVDRVRIAWRFARIMSESAPDAAGWVTLAVEFEDASEACTYILSLGTQIEVLDPPHLREQVRATALAVVAQYTS